MFLFVLGFPKAQIVFQCLNVFVFFFWGRLVWRQHPLECLPCIAHVHVNPPGTLLSIRGHNLGIDIPARHALLEQTQGEGDVVRPLNASRPNLVSIVLNSIALPCTPVSVCMLVSLLS